MRAIQTKRTDPNMSIIAFQPEIRPALPFVIGSLDYRNQREFFERVDQIIIEAGLEARFAALALEKLRLAPEKLTPKRLDRLARLGALALRCNIAKDYLGLDCRAFAISAADSTTLHWFLGINGMDRIKAPSKSMVDRFTRWIGADGWLQLKNSLNQQAATSRPCGAAAFNLADAIRLDEIFFDATCVKANIHFPTDWVLLRDITRTLMKATKIIRKHGLKERMPQEPLEFLSDMNTLCMKMSAQRRKADGRKQRKKILRAMKTLVRRVARHAKSHRDALTARRMESKLSEGRARVVIARIDMVLAQLPTAIKQAHERIIGGRQVKNEDKILSLHDSEVEVIVRGKAGEEVEFGNKLWIGETREGLIVDYKLLRGNPADTTQVKPAVERLEALGVEVKKAWGDRGLMSKANQRDLEGRGIKSGLCPRDPAELARRLKEEPDFREGLKRRAGTEARIGIFKNVFLGRPLRAKGFERREMAVGSAALAHNLWVLARLPQAKAKAKAQDGKQDSGLRRAA